MKLMIAVLLILLAAGLAKGSSLDLAQEQIGDRTLVTMYFTNTDSLAGIQTIPYLNGTLQVERTFKGDACDWNTKANAYYIGVAIGNKSTCKSGSLYSFILSGTGYIRTNDTKVSYPNGTGYKLPDRVMQIKPWDIKNPADVNSDGLVDVHDLVAILQSFG